MSTAQPDSTQVVSPRSRLADYVELTKPRLSLLSVITAMVGYFAARPQSEPAIFLATFLGTSLAAAGVASLNQWMESDTDAKMVRTADRPIPSGRVAPGSAFVMGWVLCALGLAVLYALVGGFSALFALLTIVSYLALYTPAKRWSRWSTEIGAVSGAFPPLIGWAAVYGSPASLGAILFGILFFWQIPHFMAIAWIYRNDYAHVHFPMLPVRDTSGQRVAGWSLINTVALVGVSALPSFIGLTGNVYLAGTALFGLWFIFRAVTFMRSSTRDVQARKLFLASVAWLPLQLGLLVADRLLVWP